MRNHQQQQLLELLRTLEEAHDELARQTSGRVIVNLLADCQGFAVKIGEFIEGIEGEGTRTVTLLEEYCDLLYRASVEFDPGGSIAQLRRQLIVITNSVRDELKPNKIEIAFFPYKASMFDALESIWLAAKDDPHCDVYVVPIPYYDKLPNGQMGQMHYEGDQYPEYVTITNWQEYDVEARRPDIIYIHNPYDNGNHVTSVHPMYYSKRLRDLTDMLVYVPYFVSNGDVSEGSCSLPGCIYAHKVFVQSEKVRQTYIRIYKELMEKLRIGDGYGNPESKFLALGSPKFDKVVNSRREDYALPDEWARQLKRPDGTLKKVILYNTAITSLLTGNDDVLRKLQYVFDVFRQREDVLLWWRPHPLNGTVYSSMRPHLRAIYEDIVAEYRQSCFGIYDDSADSHRAIAFSDAYYGDGGSLMALYSLTEKPLMWQDARLYEHTPFNPYAITHAADEESRSWWSVQSGNALLCMDKRTKSAVNVGEFPNEQYRGWPLYAGVTINEGKLIFAPASADEIAVYDTATETWEKIAFELTVPESDQLYFPEVKFVEVKRHEQYLYFIPCSYPAIVRYDLATGKIDYFNEWIKQLQPHIIDKSEGWFTHGMQEGPLLLLPACNANAIVVFDMNSCDSTVQVVEGTKHGVGGICYDGEHYWLTPRKNGGIIRWNRNLNRFSALTSFPDGYNGGTYPFNPPIYADQTIWLLPNQANMTVTIGLESQEMASVDAIPVDAAPFSYVQLIDGKLVAASFLENRLIEKELSGGRVREYEIAVSAEDNAKLERQGLFGDYNNETSATNLGKFIDYLHERNNLAANAERMIQRVVGEIVNPDGSAGRSIHKVNVNSLR